MATKAANPNSAQHKAPAPPKKTAAPRQAKPEPRLATEGSQGESLDFSKMSIAQLLEAEVALRNELTRRKKNAKKILLKEFQTKAKAAGISMSELMNQPRQKPDNPVKYRNPDNPDQTWAGLGKRPDWLKVALTEGKTLQDLAVGS